MPPTPMKKPGATPPAAGGGKNNEDFRRRRLSVSDIDTSEFNAAKAAAASTPTQPAPRQRRMSVSPEMGQKAKELAFPTDLVGTFSCHGVEPGHRQGETLAKINQDRGCVVHPFAENECMALFCVYDGHGAVGDKVSQYVMTQVNDELSSHPAAKSKVLGKDDDATKGAMKEVFVKVDAALKANKTIDAELSGTTAVVILYCYNPEDKTSHCYVAWVGDSRAVHAFKQGGEWKSQDLSIDQKPDTPDEMKRITGSGGFVSPPEEEWGGPARVWLDADMTLPGLAMARSIGDHLVSPVGVIAEPEVDKFCFGADEEGFIVLASDGVWEFIESEQVVKLCGKFLDKKPHCEESVTKLIETAAAKWRQEEGDYRDDITAIMLRAGPMLFKDVGGSS